MNTGKALAVFLFITSLQGCEMWTQSNATAEIQEVRIVSNLQNSEDNSATSAVIGGLIGGAIAGNTGTLVGATLGAVSESGNTIVLTKASACRVVVSLDSKLISFTFTGGVRVDECALSRVGDIISITRSTRGDLTRFGWKHVTGEVIPN